MIVCHQSTGSGFVAQNVLDNGTRVSDDDGNQICTSEFNPFYEQHIEVTSGTNVISAWESSNHHIYIMRIDNFGITSNQEKVLSKLLVFPNPATDKINITTPSGWENAQISVTNLCGQLIMNSFFNLTEGSSNILLATDSWQPGIFFIKASNGVESAIQKIIKH